MEPGQAMRFSGRRIVWTAFLLVWVISCLSVARVMVTMLPFDGIIAVYALVALMLLGWMIQE